MKLADQSLEQVIAHEIAHLHYWRHGKKHTELTRYICRLIEKGEPHGMGDNTTPAVSETGTVLMAAMQPTNMKKQYKEIRKIHASALRQLCIEKDWYTAGDNDEYRHLLLDLAEHKGNLTTTDIIEIAEDIIEHSEMDSDCTIENVAFEVARIASVSFEEAEDNIENSQKQLADAAAEKVPALEAKVKELEAHNHQMQETIDRLQRENEEMETRLERQTLTDDELTDVKRMTVDKRLALENEVKNAAERIVETADEPESAAFQNAVKDHRTAQEELEYCTDLLKKLTEIGEQ